LLRHDAVLDGRDAEVCQTGAVGVIRRTSEELVAVPDATVRLVASTYGIRASARVGGGMLLHAGPRHVEVQHADGRVETARIRDVNRAASALIVALGFVVARVVRARRSSR
jgi:hypothetical protein